MIRYCIILFSSLSSLLYSQSYDLYVERIDAISEIDHKIAFIDSLITVDVFADHPDTTALLYFEKSYALFRYNVSIEQAIAALDEGLALVSEEKHRDTWIKLWMYKGYWYRKWDKYEEAKQALTQALKYQDNNPHEWYATIQLGKTYKDRGEFDLALDIYDRAIDLAGDDHDRLATTYEVIAFVYLIMESAEGAENAIPWLEKLITLLETMDDEEHFIASMTYNLATAYLTLDSTQKAIELFDQSEQIIESCCHDDDFRSLLKESRALLLVDEGRYEEALQLFDESLQLYQHSFDLTRSDGLSTTYRNIAETYLLMEDLAQAKEYIEKAIAYRLAGIDSEKEYIHQINDHFLRSNGEKHYLISELLLSGQIHHQLYKETQDDNYLLRSKGILTHADQLVDMMRFELIEESSKEFWREKTEEVYQLLIEVHLELNDCAAAFHYAEKSKYLLMGEHLTKVDKSLSLSQSTVHIKAYRDIRIDIESSELILHTAEIENQLEKVDSVRNLLVDLKKEEDDLLSLINQTDPSFFHQNFGYNVASAEQVVKHLLKEGQTLIEYVVTDENLFIFVISDMGLECIKHSLKIDIENSIQELRQAIVSPYRNSQTQLHLYAEQAHTLYENLIAPVERLLTNDLLIIADASLAHLPFAILLREPVSDFTEHKKLKNWPYLINTYNLSYQKSASLSIYESTHSKNEQYGSELIAIHPSYENPTLEYAYQDYGRTREDIDLDLSDLYGTADEINYIKEKIKGHYYQESAASESQLKSALDKHYAICHIASHAIVDDTDPDYSKLLLSADEENDGNLHAYEIARMDIHADLVILSACNTGYGKVVAGEGIASIGKAFAQAGSPNLLMSLWPVSDRATSTLIKEYYKELLDGNDKRSSLTAAKSNFLNHVEAAYHHPYYWGGFVYYGDDRAVTLNTKKAGVLQSKWSYLLSIPIVLLTLLLRRRLG